MTCATSRPGGTYQLGDLTVSRAGFGAMQLAGPGVFGPPADRAEAVAVLRAAVELGVTHIDTADFYGPHVTNEIIREALAPYPGDLHIVTKVGARRDETGGWAHARTPPRRAARPGPRHPEAPRPRRDRRRQPPRRRLRGSRAGLHRRAVRRA